MGQQPAPAQRRSAPVRVRLPQLQELKALLSDKKLPACLQTENAPRVDKSTHTLPRPWRLQSLAAQQTFASARLRKQEQQVRHRDLKQTLLPLQQPRRAPIQTRRDPTARLNHFENRFVFQFPFFPHVVTI